MLSLRWKGSTEAMQVTIAEEERRMSDKDLRDEGAQARPVQDLVREA